VYYKEKGGERRGGLELGWGDWSGGMNHVGVVGEIENASAGGRRRRDIELAIGVGGARSKVNRKQQALLRIVLENLGLREKKRKNGCL